MSGTTTERAAIHQSSEAPGEYQVSLGGSRRSYYAAPLGSGLCDAPEWVASAVAALRDAERTRRKAADDLEDAAEYLRGGDPEGAEERIAAARERLDWAAGCDLWSRAEAAATDPRWAAELARPVTDSERTIARSIYRAVVEDADLI